MSQQLFWRNIRQSSLLFPPSSFPQATTAWHEIGHAFIAWHSSHIEEVQKVWICADGHSGRTTHVARRDPRDTDIAWCELCLCLAGFAAEMLFRGRSQTRSCAQDLQRALETAYRIGTAPAPWKTVELAEPIDFSRAYGTPLPASILEMLCQGYAKAQTALYAHPQEVSRAVGFLLHKRELYTRDLVECFGHRFGLRLLGLCGRSRIVV